MISTFLIAAAWMALCADRENEQQFFLEKVVYLVQSGISRISDGIWL